MSEQKKYICSECGSVSYGEPGICCGMPRQLAVERCSACGHSHKPGVPCECGCEK